MPTKVSLNKKFGAQTLFALRHTGEICGSNGLPLTPKSIGILGRSQILKDLKHVNLSSYLDFIRGKHERLLIVVQFYEKNLRLEDDNDHIKIAYQTLNGLAYLNQFGLVHRMLTPENILFDEEGNVKLFNYGLYHMTDGGKDVLFPIGSAKYTAPEVLLSSSNPDYISGPKVDVWSLGMVMTELVFRKPLWPTVKLSHCLRKVLSLMYCDNVLERLARESDCLGIYQEMDSRLRNFIESCLQIDCRKRPSPGDLLQNELFKDMNNLPTDEFNDLETSKCYDHPLDSWDLQELYYLWRLAGGDAHSELKRNGFIKSKPPILSMPNLILLEGMTFGHIKDSAAMLDLKVIPLPLDALLARLQHISSDAYYPLIETRSHLIDNFFNMEKTSENLPLVIKERDTEHQFHRIVLFKRLLQGYPYTAAQLCSEASKDIPPFFRGEIWAALLGVKGDLETQYIAVDKETSIPTDRQIEVDIPRCHQYNELLSSKTGHLKLKRILKAWVVSNHQYVYWQGLDSLCAPFLYLNFNNEARAYACFSAFIPKYLNNFFLKDNSAVIKEYLTKFSHLIAFHDPVLANHLHDINFVPELFAIPWFLTMFSHVFPLHKIFHLWDRLLLGDASYPLFVGLAILQQLRDTLLSSGFNECILLFSDLPEVDIQQCVQDSSKLFGESPKSISHRRYQLNSNYDSCFIITDQVLREIQTEFSPRISATDFLSVLNSNRSSLIIVDARTNTEFAEKSIRGSINIAYESIDFGKNNICDGISPGPELSILIENRNKMIVVVGNKPDETAKICRYLTAAEFSKVCSLHGGIDSLRNSGILAPSIT